MKKQCKKCGEVKDLISFYKAPGNKDGRRGDCMACHSSRGKRYYQENRDERRSSQREYYLANKDKWEACEARSTKEQKDQGRATTRAWHKRHLEELRETGLPCKYVIKRKYGLTLTQFKALLQSQNGVCKICGEPERVPGRRRLSIDHDHETGKVRGLLCFRCNTMLGKVEDSITILQKAAAYLIDFQPKQMLQPPQARHLTPAPLWP